MILGTTTTGLRCASCDCKPFGRASRPQISNQIAADLEPKHRRGRRTFVRAILPLRTGWHRPRLLAQIITWSHAQSQTCVPCSGRRKGGHCTDADRHSRAQERGVLCPGLQLLARQSSSLSLATGGAFPRCVFCHRQDGLEKSECDAGMPECCLMSVSFLTMKVLDSDSDEHNRTRTLISSLTPWWMCGVRSHLERSCWWCLRSHWSRPSVVFWAWSSPPRWARDVSFVVVMHAKPLHPWYTNAYFCVLKTQCSQLSPTITSGLVGLAGGAFLYTGLSQLAQTSEGQPVSKLVTLIVSAVGSGCMAVLALWTWRSASSPGNVIKYLT